MEGDRKLLPSALPPAVNERILAGVYDLNLPMVGLPHSVSSSRGRRPIQQGILFLLFLYNRAKTQKKKKKKKFYTLLKRDEEA